MKRIARVSGSVCLFAFLVACGGDDTDPKNAKASSLYGYWMHVPEDKAFITVMAFLPSDQARSELGYDAPVDSSVSAVWSTAYSNVAPSLVASYSVKDGFLEQTALADPVYGAGTSYRTELFEVDPKNSLSIASTAEPSGKRTYEYTERCPLENSSGFGQLRAGFCESYFETASALAFDARGRLHYTIGYGAPGDNALCPTQPTYGVLGKGCSPARYGTPDLLASSLDVFDGEIFHAYEDKDWNITLRRRAVDSEDWQVLELGMASHAALGIWVFAGERDDVVVSSGYKESQVRWNSNDFEAQPAVDEQGNAIVGRVIAASRAPSDGTLGLLVADDTSSGFYLAEEGSASFKKIEMPHNPTGGWGGGLNLLSKSHGYLGVVEGTIGSNPDGVGGRVLGGHGYFMEFQGDEWTEHGLGRTSMVLLPQRTEEKFFVHTNEKAMEPALYFGRIQDGEVVTLAPSEEEASQRAGGSPEQFRHPTFAVGPNNELAYTFTGQIIEVHRDDQRWATPLGILKK